MTLGLDVDARAPRASVLGVMSINGPGGLSHDTVRQMLLTLAALVAGHRLLAAPIVTGSEFRLQLPGNRRLLPSIDGLRASRSPLRTRVGRDEVPLS